jgi:NAD(P)-dependent dehydrogenase (short-subunit alcohol dehydrogenase family)
MDEKGLALVTGANSGMGKATSVALLRGGYRVLMLCRSAERGRAAVAEAIAASGSRAAELLLCDLADLAQVRRAAAEVLARKQPLDILVDNAGVICLDRRESRQGFELQFAVNHLAHFLLTKLLLPALEASPAARVVVVSSGAHKGGRMHLDDPNLKRGYSAWKAYGQSKLANLLFAFELARKLEKTGVAVNALHPGAVASSFGVDRDTGLGAGVMKLLRPFFLTSEEGARTAIWLATSPEAAALRGTYCYKCRPAEPSKLAKDPLLAAELWTLSEKLTQGDDA